MTEKQRYILYNILHELESAKMKNPKWPNDLIHASAIVNEESGELTKACLNFVYEDGSFDDIKKEAIQTAAMTIRFLENLS